MRIIVSFFIIVGISGATWTSYQAWGRRTLLGRQEDTPGLALGRLERKHFTGAGWRYRTIAAALYVITAFLGLIWLWLDGGR